MKHKNDNHSFIIYLYLTNYFRRLRSSSLFYFKAWWDAHIWIFKNVFYWFKFGKKNIITREEVQDKVWLLVGSVNNYKTLSFLGESLSNTVFITTNTNAATSSFKEMSRLSFHYILLRVFLLPFVVIAMIFRHGIYTLKIVDKVTESVGMYEACVSILRKGKPKAIIFANDHTIKVRGLVLAAQTLGVPTIYIQHASVSQYFPPLEFDLNLLEGEDTLKKYQQIGAIKGEVALVGMPKFDGYEDKRNRSTEIKRIGVCGNILDEESEVLELIHALKDAFPSMKISYRGHPRDQRRLKLPRGVAVSDAKQEMIFDFLCNQDLIIAGNTSTHLEATLLNILSIYYQFPSERLDEDYYGFVANGMIDKIDNRTDLTAYIEKNRLGEKQLFTKAKYYNDLVGSENEGRSKELIKEKINYFIGGLKHKN